jgi:Uma2 family endonuclease
MATALAQMVGEQRFLLERVSWEAYEALLKSWANVPTRMTYDNGRLEIMCPLLSHEQYSRVIGRLVETFTLQRRIPLHTGGSTTFKREAKKRGLEPDECYWIQNEPRMRSRKDFDPEQDPPPDLAVEVDLTSSSLDRMSIYADLGVPEVWRFNGQGFSIHLLRKGRYEPSERSPALPELTPDVVTRFLHKSDEMGETELLLVFLDWVRHEAKGEAGARKPRRPRKK